jgi:hypothetical protein
VKLADFRLGLEFIGPTGLKWRCTDIGTRTVAAINLVHEDPAWYRGPPYIIREVVLDEKDMEACHRDIDELLAERHEKTPASYLPRCVSEDFFQLLQEDSGPLARYPNRRLLRFDRLRGDGEVLHPYSARQAHNGEWLLQILLTLPRTYIEMREADFILLPVQSE